MSFHQKKKTRCSNRALQLGLAWNWAIYVFNSKTNNYQAWLIVILTAKLIAHFVYTISQSFLFPLIILNLLICFLPQYFSTKLGLPSYHKENGVSLAQPHHLSISVYFSPFGAFRSISVYFSPFRSIPFVLEDDICKKHQKQILITHNIIYKISLFI